MTTEVAAVVLPRRDLYRAAFPACEMRGEFGTDAPPTLAGHFAVFNSPTEIDSLREGNFMETIAPGAFAKTFTENRSNIKALFQHGRDPQIGDKPLGGIDVLEEDERGAYYEVSLLDTSYNRDLIPGLAAGLYGASFRFQVMREDINKTPGESAANPRGIPERTVREASVGEFGPVTFPAYAGATAGIRSITDTIGDFDALAAAGVIILDEERMNQARIFVSRAILPDASLDDPDPQIDGNFKLSTTAYVEVAPPVDVVRDESLESKQDAPPDSAEPSLAHPIRGRRDTSKSYLRKETPSWQL